MCLPLSFLLSCMLGSGGIAAAPTPTPTPTAQQELARFAGTHPVKSERGGDVYIDDELVSTIAGKTTAVPSAKKASGGDGKTETERKKKFWVQRLSTAREELKSLETRLQEVEQEIPQLWDSFYREDEPKRRDALLAPQLRQKLKARSELQDSVKLARQELENLKIAARKAGAQPSWFRNP